MEGTSGSHYSDRRSTDSEIIAQLEAILGIPRDQVVEKVRDLNSRMNTLAILADAYYPKN